MKHIKKEICPFLDGKNFDTSSFKPGESESYGSSGVYNPRENLIVVDPSMIERHNPYGLAPEDHLTPLQSSPAMK